jgi:energy-coupling factor transporter transmembrane protein EcfT
VPHHLDLYVKTDSGLHRLDPRAKMVAITGFLLAVFLAPTRPLWLAGALCLLVVCAATLGRLPAKMMCRRMLSISLMVGLPFALSRLGGEETRAAGETFAVKSWLVAGAFVVLMASTRAVTLLEITGRVPVLSGFSQLGEFVLRGADLLAEEVTHTNRAWALRAPATAIRIRLSSLAWASVSLVTRAAVRSERVGAAMALRGFDGRFFAPPARRLAICDLLWGGAFGLAALAIGIVGRWA